MTDREYKVDEKAEEVKIVSRQEPQAAGNRDSQRLEAGTLNTTAQRSLSFRIISVIAAVLIVALGLGYSFSHTGATTKTGGKATNRSTASPESSPSRIDQNLADKQDLDESKIPIDFYSPESDLKGTVKHFHFPSYDTGIEISTLSTKTQLFTDQSSEPAPFNKQVRARGEIVVRGFTPLALFVTPEGANPIYLRWFRPDEVGSLEFAPGCCDVACLKAIQHYSVLTHFDVRGSAITNQELHYLDKLPSLVWLGVSNTKATGGGIASTRSFTHLKYLHANKLAQASELIASLDRARQLTELSLENTHLTDSDMKVLAGHAPARLQHLLLAENPKITDRGLRELSALKQLRLLDLRMCTITPGSASTLESMKNLTDLCGNFRSWPPDMFAELKKALPHCHFYGTLP